MKNTSENLYLDLMKKTLSFHLWNEPDYPIETFIYEYSFLKRLTLKAISLFLKLFNLKLVKPVNRSIDDLKEGRKWPNYADTMIGLKRLENIEFCVKRVLENNIEGHLIETGVWRGGASIFMRAILLAYRISNRKVFVADSFEGLPEPNIEKYPPDKGDILHKHQFLSISKDEVAANFNKYNLLDDQVVFLKGWFKDTLPNAPIDKLAVMRIDGDMYESTMDALVNLYPKLSTGGYCIIDDYALPACKQAVDDYRGKMNIKSPIIEVDWTGVYWQKN